MSNRDCIIQRAVELNRHLDAVRIQQGLMTDNNIIVPIGKIKNLLSKVREQEHTKRCAIHVTAPSGRTIAVADLDHLIEFAIRGGMPSNYVKS